MDKPKKISELIKKIYRNKEVAIVSHKHKRAFCFIDDAIKQIANLSFLSTFERELIKDIEDLEGDKITGKYTIPGRIGVKKSKGLIYCIICIIKIRYDIIY